MEKFTDSVARKIWNQMEEEQRKCKESKIQTITEKQIKNLERVFMKRNTQITQFKDIVRK